MAYFSSSADIYVYTIDHWIAGIYAVVQHVVDKEFETWHTNDKRILPHTIIPIPCIDYATPEH